MIVIEAKKYHLPHKNMSGLIKVNACRIYTSPDCFISYCTVSTIITLYDATTLLLRQDWANM